MNVTLKYCAYDSYGILLCMLAGSLGMLAWTTMAAFGMVLARHYRSVLGGKCSGTSFNFISENKSTFSALL